MFYILALNYLISILQDKGGVANVDRIHRRPKISMCIQFLAYPSSSPRATSS